MNDASLVHTGARREPSLHVLRLEGMMQGNSFQENINKAGFSSQVSFVDLVNYSLLKHEKTVALEQGNQGVAMHSTSSDNGQNRSCVELSSTIHCDENPNAIQCKTHVEPFIFSTGVGENLDKSSSHLNHVVVDHKHFRWKRLARQGTVNLSGMVLDGSFLGKRVQDTLSDDLPTDGDAKRVHEFSASSELSRLFRLQNSTI
ncbi:hypothetical protein ACOSQ2_013601 [Xanthoceras sorbifolium]